MTEGEKREGEGGACSGTDGVRASPWVGDAVCIIHVLACPGERSERLG